MKIIAFVRNNSGPSYHRVIAPMMLMQNVDVYVTNNLLTEHFTDGCDLFVYSRDLPDQSWKIVKELQARHGFKICVDVDDYWHLDEHHILYEEYKTENFAEKQIRNFEAADLVTCTHDRLAYEIGFYKDKADVHVLPNAIPKAGQFDIDHVPHPLVRLFWQGTITHKADISILQKPINALGPLSPKMQMVMAGYMEGEPDWHSMVSDYTAGLKHQYKIIPGSHVAEYYKAYSEADICLVPLVNSKFNRHKSNLKVLEAANMGLPVVASQVHPYLDMPLLYCRGSHDWVKWIKKLVGSRNFRRDTGRKLQEFVDINFNFNKINSERKQIFEHYANVNV